MQQLGEAVQGSARLPKSQVRRLIRAKVAQENAEEPVPLGMIVSSCDLLLLC